MRPRGDRNPQARTIGVVFVVDEGQRAYIERINIRGNYRTRDYVIRREFDIGEGDPYNRALIDRAERRIKNLNFFKSVKITNEPGSAPDRVVINVDVEENSTGDFSVMGGYSTSDGWLGEVSVQERNLLGTGRFARAAVTYGQYTKGVELDYAEPYFLDYSRESRRRLVRQADIVEQLYFVRHGIVRRRRSNGACRCARISPFSCAIRPMCRAFSCPSVSDNCNNLNPDFVNTFPTLSAIGQRRDPNTAYPGVNGTNSYYAQHRPTTIRRTALRTAKPRCRCAPSLPAARLSRRRPAMASSTIRSTTTRTRPTASISIFGQDFAGAGGDTAYIKSVVDFRTYYEVVSDLVAIVHLQGGNMHGFNDCPSNAVCAGGNSGYVRMLDDFKMGPNLVRGFEPAGLGPRDITFDTTNDNIGGTNYWGASLEFQYPFYFLPKDSGFRGAVFADAGSVWGYRGETQYCPDRRSQRTDHHATARRWDRAASSAVRHGLQRQRACSLLGGRQLDLGFAVRSAALRFRLSDHQRSVRPHAVVRLRRRR